MTLDFLLVPPWRTSRAVGFLAALLFMKKDKILYNDSSLFLNIKLFGFLLTIL